MPGTITIVANAVKARMIDCDEQSKIIANDVLSYFVDGYEQMTAFKEKRWDGKSTFFEYRTATFPAGFIHRMHEALSRHGYTIRLRRPPAPDPLGPELMDAYLAVNPFGYDERYDFQVEAVRRLERYRSMVAQVATGGGKSMLCRAAVKRIMRPTLFMTTRNVLMYQMKDGFEEAGFRVGVLGDGEWSPVKGINVGMVQTISRRLADKDPVTTALLRYFEFVILEEAHEASGNGYSNVLASMPNAHYRLALTATPFMSENEEGNLRLMGAVGEVGIKVPEKLLIDRGILATPYFKFIENKGLAVRANQNWQTAYTAGVLEDRRRNLCVVEEVKRAAQHRMPAIVLVQRKQHGETLLGMLRDAGVRSEFIFGETAQDRRRRALDRLGSGDLQALIGSTILDVGVDVPAVGLVVLAGGGKAEVALRQRIGRGLRSKKNGPNVCLVVDFHDKGNRHLARHSLTRRAIIEATPGFHENILPTGADFDLPGLGF